MFRRTLLAAALVPIAVLPATAAPGPAAPFGAPVSAAASGAQPAEAPIRLAQVSSSDILVRLSQMEEEMRRLNGRVEELSFQLLQAQEDMRRRQEDNEFRFQELEGGSGGSGGGGTQPSGERQGSLGGSGDTAGGLDGTQTSSVDPGSLDLTDDEIGEMLAAPAPENGGASASAAPPAAGSEGSGELYAEGYNHLLAGDYAAAEESFQQYAQAYPGASDVSDARFWWGESLFQQGRYADAAEVFLEAQKDAPEARKGPEMMLKLGMSLARLDNRETACLTFNEAERRYPSMAGTVSDMLAREKGSANC